MSKSAPEFFTKSEAAEFVRLSARTIDAAKARGELPFYRFGARKVLFKRADLERWLAPCRVEIGGRTA